MKRVIILSKQTVFWWGVQRLLQKEARCELVAWETELDRAMQRIRELRPDVVLVDKDDSEVNCTSPTLRILSEGLGTRVIALSLDDQVISHYRGEQFAIDGVDDLLRVVNQPSAISPDADD